jgi:hypothetical protein
LWQIERNGLLFLASSVSLRVFLRARCAALGNLRQLLFIRWHVFTFARAWI